MNIDCKGSGDMANIEHLHEKIDDTSQPYHQQRQQYRQRWHWLSTEEDDSAVNANGYDLCKGHWSSRLLCATISCATLITLVILGILTATVFTTFKSVTARWQHELQPRQPLFPTMATGSDHFVSIATTSSLSSSASSLPTTISCPSHPSIQQKQEGECIFDPILLYWLPKQCVNLGLLESTLNTSSPLADPRYQIAGAFAHQIYSDSMLQHRLSFEEASQIKQNPYYVTMRFHRAHCAYIFRMISEAAAQNAKIAKERAAIGSELDNGKREETSLIRRQRGSGDQPQAVYIWREALTQIHTDHCAKVLAWREGDLDNSEKFFAGGGTCVLI